MQAIFLGQARGDAKEARRVGRKKSLERNMNKTRKRREAGAGHSRTSARRRR